jgi:hypothetical protein
MIKWSRGTLRIEKSSNSSLATLFFFVIAPDADGRRRASPILLPRKAMLEHALLNAMAEIPDDVVPGLSTVVQLRTSDGDVETACWVSTSASGSGFSSLVVSRGGAQLVLVLLNLSLPVACTVCLSVFVGVCDIGGANANSAANTLLGLVFVCLGDRGDGGATTDVNEPLMPQDPVIDARPVL